MGASITYNFPAAHATNGNNGRIVSQVINGETVTYQYDSLNRLASATGSGWAQTFAFDGFGNLITQTGTGGAPNLNLNFTGKNRQVGAGYDDNGNQLVSNCPGCDPYDIDNRLFALANAAWAGYDASNKRVFDRRAVGPNHEDRVFWLLIWDTVTRQVLWDASLKLQPLSCLRKEGDKGPDYAGPSFTRGSSKLVIEACFLDRDTLAPTWCGVRRYVLKGGKLIAAAR